MHSKRTNASLCLQSVYSFQSADFTLNLILYCDEHSTHLPGFTRQRHFACLDRRFNLEVHMHRLAYLI